MVSRDRSGGLLSSHVRRYEDRYYIDRLQLPSGFDRPRSILLSIGAHARDSRGVAIIDRGAWLPGISGPACPHRDLRIFDSIADQSILVAARIRIMHCGSEMAGRSALSGRLRRGLPGRVWGDSSGTGAVSLLVVGLTWNRRTRWSSEPAGKALVSGWRGLAVPSFRIWSHSSGRSLTTGVRNE